MPLEKTVILLIDDNRVQARFIESLLQLTDAENFKVYKAENLKVGLEIASKSKIDIIILDLFLPDSRGMDTFQATRSAVPDVPILILTGMDDINAAVEAVRDGAQDYIMKKEVSASLLIKSIMYAIERHKLMEELRQLSLYDELTGLYNRRGFNTIAEHQMKIAHRDKSSLLLIFSDLDDFKAINDTLGHKVGDEALISTADILRGIFREADILGRMGGDEFVILVTDISSEDNITIPIERLKQKLNEVNSQEGKKYDLSLSIGWVFHKPGDTTSINELIEEADSMMYKNKQQKKMKAAHDKNNSDAPKKS